METEYVATPPQQIAYVPVPPAPPARPAPARRSGLVAGLVSAGVVAGSVGLFFALLGPSAVAGHATAPPVQYRTLTIEYDFYDDSSYNWSDCSGGDGGFRDIHPGMQFTVRNQVGDVVGSTELPSTGDAYSGGHGCVWTMTVDVPVHVQHLVITGGGRGDVTYDRDDLEDTDWTAFMSLGY